MIKVLVLATLALVGVFADDDGQYRPELYGGDDGQYRPELYGEGGSGSFKGINGAAGSSGGAGRFGGASNFAGSSGFGGAGGRFAGSSSGFNGGASSGFASGAAGGQRTSNAFGGAKNSGFGSSGGLFNSLSAPSQADSQFLGRFQVDSAASNINSFTQQSRFGGGASSAALTSNPDASSRILKQEGEVYPDGYHYLYQTDNNINAEEDGKLVNVNTEQEGIKATGFFEFIGPDNVKYRIDYIADENGFIPIGAHLPTPPPIPEDIARSLSAKK